MRVALCVAVLALCVAHALCRGEEHREAAFLRRRLSPHRTGFVTIDHRFTAEGDATLSVSPSSLCARNGSFTVQWTGIPNPTPNDWIAIYSPANSTANDYLDYVWVQDMQRNGSDTGSMTVVLLNMRTDYQLRYFTGGNKLLATSNTVSVCSIPMAAHIALTGDPSQMRVGFVSSAPYTPIVLYGTDPNNLNQKALGSTGTYTADDMCNAPANVVGARLFRDPGFMQDVLLTNLPPSTRIFYTYGAADGSEMSTDVLEFTTAPPVGSTGPVSIMVYGDMGDGVLTPDAAGTAQRMVDHMATTNFFLHIGDISYARSIGWVWDEFFNLIYNFASRVPYMVGIGNHEYDHTGGVNKDPSGAPGTGFHPDWGNYGDDSAGECAVPPFHRFHMPDNGNSLFWYSFNYGNVHVLHMSTEHDYTPGSPQYQWMQQDLAAVDRTVTPWIILGGHRPMYTSEDYPSDFKVSQNMQKAFEDLLHQYGVDIAVWGHYHAYERTCAVYQQNCMTDGSGTTHIVVGTAGASLDNVDWYPETWSLNHCNEFGYGKISITTDGDQQTTSLQWDFFFNANDTRFDTVTITKPLPPPHALL